MDYEIKLASDCSPEELRNFKKIVIEAKEVKKETFDGLIKKNPILLFLPNSKEVSGVGALKVPDKIYKEKVFQKSHSTSNPSNFLYELGWIVSLKQNEGIGKTITGILSGYKKMIYATVRVDNEIMNHILLKTGFVKNGNSYDSDRGNYKINLFIKGN